MDDTDVRDWLDISRGLFGELIPRDLAEKVFTLTPAEHAFLAHRESRRVDDALISMALAGGEAGVKAVFGTLESDTVMAMASRWLHYAKAWNTETDELRRQELTPGLRAIWPAIFLAMMLDRSAAVAAADQLDREAAAM